METAGESLSEAWLSGVGFKWSEVARDPSKHWLLWLGGAMGQGRMFGSVQDFGIELSKSTVHDGEWFCWFRADLAGRYSRFLHVRMLRTQAELITLIEALTEQSWNPDNHRYGFLMTPEQAERDRQESERLDRVLLGSQAWYDHEKDPTRAGASAQTLNEQERA